MLSGGCAKYARYQQATDRFEREFKADKEAVRSVKTMTVLAPKTDRKLEVNVMPSLLSRPGTTRELKGRSDTYLASIRSAMGNATLVGSLADAVVNELQGAGYRVNVVFSDEQSVDRQVIQEADFGTDLTYALYRPEVGLLVDVNGLSPDRFFPWAKCAVLVVQQHKLLTLGGRRSFPDGNELRPYWLDSEWDEPNHVRTAMQRTFKYLAERLTTPLKADLKTD